MKIVCISDTHGAHDELDMPSGDILIHTGDFTNMGGMKEIIAFNAWLARQSYTHKIVIAGNHDLLFQEDFNLARSLLTAPIYLQDDAIEINGLTIYGSPWTPMFYDWAFMLDRGPMIRAKWEMIPHKLDLLLTHGPPAGILDKTGRGEHAGCADLRNAVQEVKPRFHIFGHIHDSGGIVKGEHTTFVNAASQDRLGEIRKPIVLEV